MIKITQHRNRKLYSTDLARYTNLTEIKELVQSGEKVQVIDFAGTDVTVSILAQCVTLTRNLSVEKLARLIQEGK
jgi:polyhydroxyalkanoate synthesis regulator protein